MTSAWQTDSKTDSNEELSQRFDNGSTLTNERTNGLTNDYQDQGSNRLVPNAPNPVDKGRSFRVVVACINWKHPSPVPHAVAYVLRDGEMIADSFFATWDEAMEYAVPLARHLARVAS